MWLVEEERNRQIRQAVQMLPKIQRYVIEQYFWEGKSLRQIARERDVNIKTVRESYHSAMAKLYDVLFGILISLVICYIFGFILTSFISNNYKFIIQARYLTDRRTIGYTFFFLMIEGLIILLYYYKHY